MHGGGGPTLPQELIDRILDLTDKETLKSCSLVAYSFLRMSQKHIFSHIEFESTSLHGTQSDAKVQDLFQILSCSPHLALNVRSISLLKNRNGSKLSWMRSEILPVILLMLVNLTTLSIESDIVGLDWHTLSSALIKALHVTVSLSSLTSMRLISVRFEGSTDLISLLQCSKNLNSLVFSTVHVWRIDSKDSGTLNAQLPGLLVLKMNPFLRPLVHSVTSTFDLRNLRHLQTTLGSSGIDPAEIQPILDATGALMHYHAQFSHTDLATVVDLRNLTCLRTLEITIHFKVLYPDADDPVGCAKNILATLPNPSPIEQIILNVIVAKYRLPRLSRLADLETLLLAPKMAALRNITVNLDSFDFDFNTPDGRVAGERKVSEAFPILREREILDIGFCRRWC
ncbi:hypothetical protein B0H11DRAFT_1938588 [Mycena galericulata]|nr:hypothetical protein B0H11DRAFT_1938588 [Mycena galericulata]